MTDSHHPRPGRRLIADPAVIRQATTLADSLESQYKTEAAKPNAPFSINILIDDYPSDDAVDAAVEILWKRGLRAEPLPFNCAGGRSGSCWLTPLGHQR